MAKPLPPKPVKLFVGMLTGFPDLIDETREALISHFGAVDSESDRIKFDFTDYYKKEMGSGLVRKFFSFARLIAPDDLAGIKLKTNEIEEDFARRKKAKVARPVNIDPGYLTSAKVVLATTKDYSHRIYLKEGIYAEATLRYFKGAYQSWPWTYPDYKTPQYLSFFHRLRNIFLAQTAPSG
jgi:hypothetical protein